jgi:Tfp pilus assembly protein PilO
MRLSLRRIFDEKRRLMLPVLAGLGLSILLFVGVVYPLSARVRSTEARAQAAEQALQAAQREDAEARGVAAGRDRTDAALTTFYKEVLPPNMAEARQATFLRLTQLAEQHNLQHARRDTAVESGKVASVDRMRITMSLQGSYEDIRRFIYQVESGADFIVIDSVALRQGVEAGAPLTLDLTLSTYYRAGPGGA